MDNFHIDISSEGRENFSKAFQLAWRPPGQHATHYFHHSEKGLILLWNKENKALELPYPLSGGAAEDFVWHWLAKQSRPKVDIDGDVGDGFRIYTEGWGRIQDFTYSFMAIQKIPALYGK